MLASRLRLWFGLSDRVDRRAYFATGLGLMALKYLSDSAVVWAYTGRVWSPLDYANPVWSVREHALQGVPSAVVLALAVWTLPFLWVGIGMSVRRAVDAGRSAWLALLFFVPYVNYLLMLALSLLPTAPRHMRWGTERAPVLGSGWRSALFGVAVSLGLTIPTVLFSVYFKKEYSVGLFLGTPFTIGAITANIYNSAQPRSKGDTAVVVLFALTLAALSLLLFAEREACASLWRCRSRRQWPCWAVSWAAPSRCEGRSRPRTRAWRRFWRCWSSPLSRAPPRRRARW